MHISIPQSTLMYVKIAGMGLGFSTCSSHEKMRTFKGIVLSFLPCAFCGAASRILWELS